MNGRNMPRRNEDSLRLLIWRWCSSSVAHPRAGVFSIPSDRDSDVIGGLRECPMLKVAVS